MRIAKDQKERYDKEMAEKMENAKKAQVEKEAAEAAALAQAQAAKKAAEEAKAIAKAAAKTAAKSKRSADEKTGAKDEAKEVGVAKVETEVGVAVDGATGDNQDFIVEYFVEEEEKEEEEKNHSYEDSDIENEGQECKGGKGAEAVREENREGYGEEKKLVKEDSRVPDTEIGKKFKDCESYHYRLKQFTFYSFKILAH